MAQTKSDKPTRDEQGNDRTLARPHETRAARRWEPGYQGFGSPFDLMDQMTQEMDRWFDRMTRNAGFPRLSGATRSPIGGLQRSETWMPRIEAGQKGDAFIVRADLPGLRKEDVDVEVTENAISIRGERREEREEEREGYWRSEREYGQFHRTIPLPEGVIVDNAQATFRDGVLEVSMPCAPSQANRGRKVDIKS
jgi:HSP20 family protein